jgi:hypothetical protein
MPKEWAFHFAAFDGVDTAVFSTKNGAEEAHQEMLAQEGLVFVSKVMPLVPGETHWVVHIRRKDGRMQSFGFESRFEAMQFKNKMREVEIVELVSSPVEAELKD